VKLIQQLLDYIDEDSLVSLGIGRKWRRQKSLSSGEEENSICSYLGRLAIAERLLVEVDF
jgi:hypothetical protein